MEQSIKIKVMPEFLHPENAKRYIAGLGEAISLFLEILGDNEKIANEYGDRSIRAMAMLNYLKRDISDTCELEINI